MPDVKRSVLVLFAHPALQKSHANVHLLAAVRDLEEVTVHDLCEIYPDFCIDARREQELLAAHDVILFQFPFYWYSTPALLKQWQDIVLEYGWAYGEGGHELEGKTALCATTTGGSDHAYGEDGHNRFSVPEFLRPLEQTARLCRMEWLPPFIVHSAGRREPSEFVQTIAPDYRSLLIALRDGTLDEAAALRAPSLSAEPRPYPQVSVVSTQGGRTDGR